MALHWGGRCRQIEGAPPPQHLPRFRWRVDRVGEDRWFDATVLPQLHVLAWGNERGV